MKERIILSIELVDGEQDARASMTVPTGYAEGVWLENAIKELRQQCKGELAHKKQYDGDGDHY